MAEQTTFTLREWAFSDALSVAHHANDKAIADNLRNGFPYPYTEADAASYIESCAVNPEKKLVRAICADGQAVGSIGLFLQGDVYEKSAELGYWLGKSFWGRGIMTRAIRGICDEAFALFDIERIFAEPYAHNMGSRRALEKAGFTLEGIMKNSVYKNETLYDSCMYALLKQEAGERK
ncbi:MAG TPA: GNAT family N-acetyltransferase [Clostridiales bacterium]|nr:GNAT family N-acetyltransferase [Clostridiales bacterium]